MSGSTITYYRKQRGMTQVELSKKSGISRAYLSLIENERLEITDEMYSKIAKALDVSIDELKNEDSTPTNKLINRLSELTDSEKITWDIEGHNDLLIKISELLSCNADVLYLSKFDSGYYGLLQNNANEQIVLFHFNSEFDVFAGTLISDFFIIANSEEYNELTTLYNLVQSSTSENKYINDLLDELENL